MNTTKVSEATSNKETVQQVLKAFLNADIEAALSYMTEDVRMGWPGFFNLAPGKDAVREFFKSVPEMTSSSIEDFIEDGNKIAATGSVTSRDEDGSLKNSFFCDIYELENGKVKPLKVIWYLSRRKSSNLLFEDGTAIRELQARARN